jgi:protocatechuate 3,4-dioxygenase beta subunit
MDHHDVEGHDLGLSHDLPVLLTRRRALALLGGAGLVSVLAACGSSDGSTPAGARGSRDESASASSDAEIPEETSGPFPADGSNGVNVLTESGIVRNNIRPSFGGADGVAIGVPLTFTLTVVDLNDHAEARPREGAAVYAWQCDRDGNYSLYSAAARDQNYLRGVQETDMNGAVTFTSIYPGCYSGRWPHIHFEVYPSLADATAAKNRLRTSQLALPKDVSEKVYATAGYEASVANLASVSLDTDLVFRDGYSLQLAKVTGSVADGLVATLRVPI